MKYSAPLASPHLFLLLTDFQLITYQGINYLAYLANLHYLILRLHRHASDVYEPGASAFPGIWVTAC